MTLAKTQGWPIEGNVENSQWFVPCDLAEEAQTNELKRLKAFQGMSKGQGAGARRCGVSGPLTNGSPTGCQSEMSAPGQIPST